MATMRERDYSEWRKLRSITMKEDKGFFQHGREIKRVKLQGMLEKKKRKGKK